MPYLIFLNNNTPYYFLIVIHKVNFKLILNIYNIEEKVKKNKKTKKEKPIKKTIKKDLSKKNELKKLN